MEYLYFEVQYDQNENFYLELECGPAQSYMFSQTLFFVIQDWSSKSEAWVVCNKPQFISTDVFEMIW